MICRLFTEDNKSRTYQHESAVYLLRHAMLAAYGVHYDEKNVVLNPHGKPSLGEHPEIQYNISHCMGCVAAIIDDAGNEVGIDVEKIRPFSESVAKRVLSSAELSFLKNSTDPERDFFRFWVLKESYVKALGLGIGFGLRNIAFSWDEKLNIRSTCENASFTLIEDVPGYILGACILHQNK